MKPYCVVKKHFYLQKGIKKLSAEELKTEEGTTGWTSHLNTRSQPPTNLNEMDCISETRNLLDFYKTCNLARPVDHE